MLQIKNVSKRYKTGELVQMALDDVSLNLRDSEFISVLGPSGSGKTTLLNVVGGLDRYDSGDLIINGISTNLCNGFAGVNQALTTGFANAEVSNNARQIADMQQAFASQTAIAAGMNGIQSQLAQCCCDNRLATANLNSTILSENCADRAALSDGIRDLLVNQTANTQRLVDTTNQAVQGVYNKICQLELDAKNDKISELQAQLAQARNDASQNAQTQALMADNLRQTQALEQYLNPAPIPAYVVQNPNCCNSNYYASCGCSAR